MRQGESIRPSGGGEAEARMTEYENPWLPSSHNETAHSAGTDHGLTAYGLTALRAEACLRAPTTEINPDSIIDMLWSAIEPKTGRALSLHLCRGPFSTLASHMALDYAQGVARLSWCLTSRL